MGSGDEGVEWKVWGVSGVQIIEVQTEGSRGKVEATAELLAGGTRPRFRKVDFLLEEEEPLLRQLVGVE